MAIPDAKHYDPDGHCCPSCGQIYNSADEISRLSCENETIKAEFKETLACRHARIDALCCEGKLMREALEKLAKLPCGELDTLAGCLAAVHIIAGAALCDEECDGLLAHIKTLQCWKEGAELVFKDLGVTYTAPVSEGQTHE